MSHISNYYSSRSIGRPQSFDSNQAGNNGRQLSAFNKPTHSFPGQFSSRGFSQPFFGQQGFRQTAPNNFTPYHHPAFPSFGVNFSFYQSPSLPSFGHGGFSPYQSPQFAPAYVNTLQNLVSGLYMPNSYGPVAPPSLFQSFDIFGSYGSRHGNDHHYAQEPESHRNRPARHDPPATGQPTPDIPHPDPAQLHKNRPERHTPPLGGRPNPDIHHPDQSQVNGHKPTGLTDAELANRLPSSKVRNPAPINGYGNNPFNPQWGQAETEFRREFTQDPSRGIGGVTETSLPSAREISNAVFNQSESTQNVKGLSDMFWLWGQFLDHDITLSHDSDEHANIPVPTGDRYFDPQATGTQSLPFERTEAILDSSGNRQFLNNITAFIDGSNIYGSDQETLNSLRAFNNGLLATSDNNLLPLNDEGSFIAGDVRANENAGLTSMHTLWVREHNRIANELFQQNPDWNDNQLFEATRKQVIAQMQAVTYNEFVPSLLGQNALSPYQGYDPDVNPQISNAFATAAYRFGHTMVSPTLLRIDENGNEIPEGNLSLREAFFRPDKVQESGIDPILRGFSSQTAQAADPMVIDDLRNFLFGAPGSGGLDLVSLNIQRGRDHEIPSYNSIREQLGLGAITSFDDPIFQDGFGQKLASVYDNPNDVDAWVGGLAENRNGDALLGETLSSILADQFQRLRDGDRFWYQRQYSDQQDKLDYFNNLTLSEIIKRNTDIQNLQNSVFVASNIHT